MLDLRTIPISVINLPEDEKRRAHITETFTKLGLTWTFSDGVRGPTKMKAVATAQQQVFDSNKTLPFLMCEDDVELKWHDCVLPHIPEDADIIYLATSQQGCLPLDQEHIDLFGPRAYFGFALAEEYDEIYMRVYSMISAIAVLVVSERGRERFMLEQTKARRRNAGVDIRYAAAMPDLNVYATRTPMFAEAAAVQVDVKQNDGRFRETHAPLPVAHVGEERRSENGFWSVRARVRRTEAGGLAWEVVDGLLKKFQHAERQGVVALHSRLKIPPSPYVGEGRARQIFNGRYEAPELIAALKLVQPGSRMVEMGAGIGFVGACVAKNVPKLHLRSFDGNPDLIPHISNLYEINGLSERAQTRNEIVVSGPNPPEHMTFHIHGSYLGSSLHKSSSRERPAVDVPTLRWNELVSEFAPDTLMMDIEGGELEFLEHADLSSINTVILEFHPKRYGQSGQARCEALLRAAGFEPDPEVSTPTVWGAVRKRAAEPLVAKPVRYGDYALCDRVDVLERALVVPRHEMQMGCGVLDQTGRFCEFSREYERPRKSYPLPDPVPEPVHHLRGTYLFAGKLHPHFGHFLLESTARLWALDEWAQHVDGIVFMPLRTGTIWNARRRYLPLINLLTNSIPTHNVVEPTTFDTLIVPEPGFGLEGRMCGSPRYIEYMRKRVKEAVLPSGSGRLYISRSGLRDSRGGVIAEERIDALMAANGYEIFHPQRHSPEEQLARYAAARKLVALDGSALHMASFALPADAEVAMILRRSGSILPLIANQINNFSGAQVHSIDVLKNVWVDQGASRITYSSIGELDFRALQEQLTTLGFIGNGHQIEELTPEEIRHILNQKDRPPMEIWKSPAE